MKNKGFTLIEILAVVLLLGLLALVIGPRVLEQKNKKEKELTEAEKQVLYTDAGEYVRDNLNIYNIKPGNIFCIQVNTLINEDKVSMDAESFKNKIVKISVDDNNNFINNIVDKCNQINKR